MQHFVYLWHDKVRNMFYVGSHSGSVTDNYLSSSRWLSAEIRYRPNDFRRKILKHCASKQEALSVEYSLITKIKESEYGKKYYNLKQGKPKGSDPWNKGKTDIYSQETLDKMSKKKLGNKNTKGTAMPSSANNGRKSAQKLSQTVTGRTRKYLPDGSWTWQYPNKIAD